MPFKATPGWRWAALCALLSLCTACGDDDASAPQTDAPGAWFKAPLQALPDKLSGFGIYADPNDLTKVAPKVITYTPKHPLWSNASEKTRHLVVPDGTTIDNSADYWQLPVGSVLFKTFSYPRAQGALRHIETRVLRRGQEGWEYGSYLWDEDGRDATQLDMRRAVPVEVTLEGGERFEHMVPNKLECRSCHEASPSFVLGLSDLQLPVGQLRAGDAAPLVQPLKPAQALDDDPETAWVKGYMLGNCTHCHNGWGESPNSTYSLYPDDLLAQTINKDTEGNASAVGKRIIPGAPEESVLYQALRGYDDDPELKAMPPLGVQRLDQEAIARIKAWITALPAQ